jgi:sec-independent protein translocase protein TatA
VKYFVSVKPTTLPSIEAQASKEAQMFLFGPVGPTELLLILILVVIIFGARRLPELGKGLGEGIRNFKKGFSGKEDENKKSESEKTGPPDNK